MRAIDFLPVLTTSIVDGDAVATRREGQEPSDGDAVEGDICGHNDFRAVPVFES